MSEVWATKYRPKSIDDFYGSIELVEEMREVIATRNVQHYLFHSREAGTGKTTMAHILASSLDYQLHTFNASSKRTRGIDFVEEDIIPLANSGHWETIILLDEADRLTIQAQDALKGVIENATCYFILTCNDISKVSDWLKSRCQVRKFDPVGHEHMVFGLGKIATSEGFIIPETEIRAICYGHIGDMRNAIGFLQMYCHTPDDVKPMRLRALAHPPFHAQRFLRLCVREGAVADSVKMSEGIDCRSFISQVFEYAVNADVQPQSIMKVVEASIVSERDLLMGVDEKIVRWNFCRMLASRGLYGHKDKDKIGEKQ